MGPLQCKPLPNVTTSLSLLAAAPLKGPNLSNLKAFKTTFHRLVLPAVPQRGWCKSYDKRGSKRSGMALRANVNISSRCLSWFLAAEADVSCELGKVQEQEGGVCS